MYQLCVKNEESNQEKVVLTTKQLADYYNVTPKRLQQNFCNNRDFFVEGVHYHLLTDKKLRDFKKSISESLDSLGISQYTSQLYVWTEAGALRHCKIINTKEAWGEFEKLTTAYFVVKELVNKQQAIEQQSSQQLVQLQSKFAEEISVADTVTRMLNINDASKIKMLKRIYKENDKDYPIELPTFERNDSRALNSATRLLKDKKYDVSAKQLFRILEDAELVERVEISYKNGKRTAKRLTEAGLKYGENLISPYHNLEPWVYFYEDKFDEMMSNVVVPRVIANEDIEKALNILFNAPDTIECAEEY